MDNTTSALTASLCGSLGMFLAPKAQMHQFWPIDFPAGQHISHHFGFFPQLLSEVPNGRQNKAIIEPCKGQRDTGFNACAADAHLLGLLCQLEMNINEVSDLTSCKLKMISRIF